MKIGDADLIIEELVFTGNEEYWIFLRWLNSTDMSSDSSSLNHLISIFERGEVRVFSNNSGESVRRVGEDYLFRTSEFDEQGELLMSESTVLEFLHNALALIVRYERNEGTILELEAVPDTDSLYGYTKYEFIPH